MIFDIENWLQSFLTPPHYINLQNSMISFDYSWFLAKNLSNFVSLPWKFHNRYCHRAHTPQTHSLYLKQDFPLPTFSDGRPCFHYSLPSVIPCTDLQCKNQFKDSKNGFLILVEIKLFFTHWQDEKKICTFEIDTKEYSKVVFSCKCNLLETKKHMKNDRGSIKSAPHTHRLVFH